MGSGCSTSSSWSRFHHAPAATAPTEAAMAPAKRRRVHSEWAGGFSWSVSSMCAKAWHLRLGSQWRHSVISRTQKEGADDVENRGLTTTEELSVAREGFCPVNTWWRTTPKAKRSVACEGGLPL